MKKVGLLINPVAGMGGSVGLKGTDHKVAEAIARGAVALSMNKTKLALKQMLSLTEEITIITASGDMGESVAKEMGFLTKIVYESKESTDYEDTLNCLREIIKEEPDIVLFTGGDGTARDVYSVLSVDYVALGIPAGVKMHSPVFAKTPQDAGVLAKIYIEGKNVEIGELEVLDINEEEYRQGRVNTALYGYLYVPIEKKHLQAKKAPTPLSQRAQQSDIAAYMVKTMEKDTYYVLGPGTTIKTISEIMGTVNTLIGVDIVYNKETVATDVTEHQILEIIKDEKAKLIVTPTGGQGYLLGRGNQQISAAVIQKIKKENVIIASTLQKIAALGGDPLLVDTGDIEANKLLKGYMRVITGFGDISIYRVDGPTEN